MERIRIVGGRPLEGTVRISGAKNASLPDVCAALLTDKTVLLRNVPEVRDIRTMGKVLSAMGAQVQFHVGGCVEINAGNLTSVEATYDLVKTMRASVLVLGPILAREGRARVSLPGGCAIGDRPIDLHLTALEKMGAQIKVERGYVEATAPSGSKRLRGAEIVFETVTVTGTENILMSGTWPTCSWPWAPASRARGARRSASRAWTASGAPTTTSSPTASKRVPSSRPAPWRAATSRSRAAIRRT